MRLITILCLVLLSSCSQEPEVFTGPFIVRDGITYHQDTNEPLTGIIETFYENGQLERRGNYKDGKPEGLWERFYEYGQLKQKLNYKKRKSEGSQEPRALGHIYIENGKVNKNQDRQHDHTPKISSFIQSFEGRGCPYYNDQTKKYFDWHRSQFVKEIIRFNEGDVIKHNKFGVGKIISTSGDQVQNLSIKFEDQATRTIRSDFANLKLIL